MKKEILRYGLLVLLVSTSSAFAETVVQKRQREIVRPNILSKLTAGTQDRYQAIVSPDEKTLFFTKNENLAAHIFKQNLGDSISSVASVGSQSYDTRDPAISPDGKFLAFTSFENNARGDICVLEVKNNEKLLCTESFPRGAEQPAWISNDEVVYIEHGTDDEKASLIRYQLSTKKKTVLFSDDIVSFTVHPNKNFAVYASSQTLENGVTTRVLKLRELAGLTAKPTARIIRVDLPGLAGFPRFDESGKWIYFSQFFSDTNGDTRVDANDNSVVFRMPWLDLSRGSDLVLPEQLTSLENNCNYAYPFKSKVYLTCAYEGSLDIYSLPSEGALPHTWSLQKLQDAHRVARTTAERILILNSIRYRYLPQSTDVIEQIFSNHFVGREYAAAQYYVAKLIKNASLNFSRETLKTYQTYLTAAQREQEQPLGRPGRDFLIYVEETIRELRGLKSHSPLTMTVIAYLEDVLGSTAQAKSTWKKIEQSDFKVPMSLYLYTIVGERLMKKSNASHEDWIAFYSRASQNVLFSEETQSHYALATILHIEKSTQDLSRRLELVEKRQNGLPSDSLLKIFLDAESAALKVAQNSEKKARRETFKHLDDMFIKYQKRYFVRRGLYILSLNLFSEQNLDDVLNQVADRWLTSVVTTEAEYIYAREQYILARLDRAYAYWAQNNLGYAADIFYGIIRVTDDPEAHIGYFKTLSVQKKRATLEEKYKDLVAKNFVDENFSLFEALKALDDNVDNKGFETAQHFLKSISDATFNPSVREFLLGVTYHQQCLASRDRLSFDVGLAEEANRHYGVALDLSRGNKRMQAAILNNLGLLHFSTHNFGDAVLYLAERSKIPFESVDEEINFLWILARAQFYYRAPDEAFKTAQKGLSLAKKQKNHLMIGAFSERSAFYAMSANDFAKAEEFYSIALKQSSKNSAVEFAKMQMALGYSQLKQKKSGAALKNLSSADDFFKSHLEKTFPSTTQVVQTSPKRLHALTLGLLAQAQTNISVQKQLRRERFEFMKTWDGDLKKLAVKEDDWRDFLLRDCNKITAIEAQAGKWGDASQWQISCSDVAKENYDVKSDALDTGFYQHIVNALVVASQSGQVQVENAIWAQEQGNEIVKKLEPIAPSNDALALRWVRLKLEILVFGAKKNPADAAALREQIQGISKSDELKNLQPPAQALVTSAVKIALNRLKRN